MFYINKDKTSHNLDKSDILMIIKGPEEDKKIPVRVIFKSNIVTLLDKKGEINYSSIEELDSVEDADSFVVWISYELLNNEKSVKWFEDFVRYKTQGKYVVI